MRRFAAGLAVVIGITLIGFTVLYGGLAAIEVGLLAKRIRGTVAEVAPGESTDHPVTFAY